MIEYRTNEVPMKKRHNRMNTQKNRRHWFISMILGSNRSEHKALFANKTPANDVKSVQASLHAVHCVYILQVQIQVILCFECSKQ